jgi:hypothetical protein
MPALPEQQESVVTVVWRDQGPRRVDVLFVIDDSPAMQPYAAGLADAMRMNAYDLFSIDSFVDVHLGMITANVGDERDIPNTPINGSCAGWGEAAAFRRSSLVEGTYVEFRNDGQHDTAMVPNALASLADVGSHGCARARPLEAMRIALDHDPHDGGFRRADAQLAVVIIAAQDDDSPGSLDDYAAFLKDLQPNVTVQIAGGRPLTAICGEQATDRLYAFSQRFPFRSYLSSICTIGSGGLLGQAVANVVSGFGPLIGHPCFDEALVDVDDATPGIQPDCSVSEYTDRGRPDEHERLLAHCGDGALPCWRIVEDSQCTLAQHLRLDVDRGGEDPPDNDVVEAQCVSS